MQQCSPLIEHLYPCRAVLVDFDGLLISTEYAGWQSWRKFYLEHGADLPISRFALHVGGNTPMHAWSELDQLAGRPLDHQACEARRREHRDGLLAVYRGALELLRECRAAGLKIGLVSNSPLRWISRQSQRLGLSESLFDAIVEGEHLPPKPAPDSYRKALGLLKTDAADAIAFEDSARGVLAAQAAGIRCIAVPNEVTKYCDLSMANLIVASLHHVRVVPNGVACVPIG